MILPVVLTRDVEADCRHPGAKTLDITIADPDLRDLYRGFLNVVIENAAARAAGRTLEGLWSLEPSNLVEYLRSHPELGTAEAILAARHALSSGPPPGDSGTPLRARLQLVKNMAAGDRVEEAAERYQRTILSHWTDEVKPELDRLLQLLEQSQGSEQIPSTRRALQICRDAQILDLERWLSADLARRLLEVVGSGERGRIEEGIALLKRAQDLSGERDQLWVDVTGNLAVAYSRRQVADATTNWMEACRLYEIACEASDRVAVPKTWATNHSNYGLCLATRPGGSSEKDLTLAVRYLKLALLERSLKRDPIDWAYSQTNLGVLYQRRSAPGDRQRASECYEAVLTHVDPSRDWVLWANAQHNLSTVYLGADPPDLAAAEEAAMRAVVVAKRHADDLFTGRVMMQLGAVLERQRGLLAPETLKANHAAIELLPPRLVPELHLQLGGKLADAHQQLADWEAAADVYHGMLLAFDALYDVRLSAAGRRRALKDNPRLGRWAAYALARAGRPALAIEAIEQSRARELSIAVRRDTADLRRLRVVDNRLADDYESALLAYSQAAGSGEGPGMLSEPRTKDTAAADRRMREAIENIHRITGFEDFLEPLTVQEIAQAGGLRPVIYLVSAPYGSYALCLQRASDGKVAVDALVVDSVTSRDVAEVMLVDADGKRGLLTAQFPGTSPHHFEQALHRLEIRLRPLLRAMVDWLDARAVESALLIPTGLLGLAPLQALVVQEGSQVLDEVVEIHLAPSAGAYRACQTRAGQSNRLRFVGLADPEPARPLPGSRVEVASISRLFERDGGATIATGRDATAAWLLDQAESASHLHLACHGHSDIDDSGGAHLSLGNGTQLSMDDLVSRGTKLDARLVVASACQSGHYETGDTPDEFIGVAAGFLQAGAPCAIVSLWPVTDDATALLMTRFYELLDPSRPAAQQEPVAALRAARQWLRHLSLEDRNVYLNDRPLLAQGLRRLGLPKSTRSHARACPYSGPADWAAFVAYGC